MGEAFNSYLFVEYGDKIVVIDKHAAHERLIFEELRERMAKTEIDSQILMIPIEVMLTTNEMQALENYKSQIEKIGFSLEFKKHSVLVSSIPSNINVNAVDEMIITFADRILNETGNIEISKNLIFERALYQASCKAAIKAGREYPKEHVEWLVDKLMQLQDITFCPHGRPIAIELSKNHLDHQFERK
jgi:DNA mismatch repair protein MutL